MLSKRTERLIPKIQHYFAGQPIKKAWLFGSLSRGNERPDSDIDLLVEYDNTADISLLTISKITVQMKKLLGRNVDLVEQGQLLPFAATSANRDKILIYERAD